MPRVNLDDTARIAFDAFVASEVTGEGSHDGHGNIVAHHGWDQLNEGSKRAWQRVVAAVIESLDERPKPKSTDPAATVTP